VRVLITDAHSKQAGVIARSLKSIGVEVHLASFNEYAPHFASRYCDRSFISPRYEEKEQYIEFFVSHVQKYHYNLIIPCDDVSVLYFSEAREQLLPYVQFILPDHNVVETVAYKDNLMRFSEKHNITIPKTFYPERKEDYERCAQKLSGQTVVIKGVRGAGSRQIRYAKKGNLNSSVNEILEKGASYNPRLPILQEYIPGVNRTVYVLCDDERILSLVPFEHQKTFPKTGGIPAKVITRHDPKLITFVIQIVKALKWRGMLGIACRLDWRDGEYKLIEINPRFGNSTQIAIASGVDIPAVLWRHFINKEKVSLHIAKEGIVHRSLLPYEILYLLSNPIGIFGSVVDFFKLGTSYDLLPFEWEVFYRSLKWTWWELQDRLRSGSFWYPCGYLQTISKRRVQKREIKKRHKKRHIVYLDAGSGSGGSSVSLARLLKVLDRGQWDCTVIAHQTGSMTDEILSLNVPVFTIPLRPRNTGRGLIGNLISFHIPLFIRLLREFFVIKPDIIHLNNSPKTPFSAILAGWILRIPVVSHLRVTRRPNRLEKTLMYFIKFVIVISPSAKILCEKEGIAEKKIICIPDGVALQEKKYSLLERKNIRKQFGIHNGEPLIGVVGRLMPQKGQAEFLKAIEKVVHARPDVKVAIIGDECEDFTDYLPALRKIVDQKGLSKNIYFTGWIESPENLYPAFDIFAQTSLLPEGFSLVCLDAMVHGIPIVSTRVGAIPDLIEEGVTGILVPPKDANQFAQALLSLIDEKDTYQKMSQASQSRAKCFDIQRTKEKIESLYYELQENGKKYN